MCVLNASLEPEANVNSFLKELAVLCRKSGIGITGVPTLFLMELDDYQLDYVIDADSNLHLG